MALDEQVRKIIQGRNFAFLATVGSDGSPQVTPVWVDEENGYILVNTAAGRVKERNTRRNPAVAVAVPEWSNPYRYAYVRGRVVEWITGPKADEHIDKLAVKYTGEKFKWRRPGDVRVILKIKPDQAKVLG
ncbi:MAG: PPOX class F420-dependent oxidoreductase [Candidatus Caldarchaeum sp.]|nr:PPOX class F420-dependent oxidoreductase [Candidatus Caldarchaeum sp.]